MQDGCKTAAKPALVRTNTIVMKLRTRMHSERIQPQQGDWIGPGTLRISKFLDKIICAAKATENEAGIHI